MLEGHECPPSYIVLLVSAERNLVQQRRWSSRCSLQCKKEVKAGKDAKGVAYIVFKVYSAAYICFET